MYKGQYTEPEGDIGYKTSTVAVKTLKGIITVQLMGTKVSGVVHHVVQVSLITVK